LGNINIGIRINTNLTKVNAYRVGAFQQPAFSPIEADTVVYCSNLFYTFPKRLSINKFTLMYSLTPNNTIAGNLFAYLAVRFSNTFGPNGYNCTSILNVAPPVVPLKNEFGVYSDADINVPQYSTPSFPSIPTIPSIPFPPFTAIPLVPNLYLEPGTLLTSAAIGIGVTVAVGVLISILVAILIVGAIRKDQQKLYQFQQKTQTNT